MNTTCRLNKLVIKTITVTIIGRRMLMLYTGSK